jgi:hypothetical protein
MNIYPSLNQKIMTALKALQKITEGEQLEKGETLEEGMSSGGGTRRSRGLGKRRSAGMGVCGKEGKEI